ncbi:unnamed protein product [Ostreobium quekettii]|uniref:Peptidase S1 domain-containing protein n=1 Tax=Ostreobium quekettii TaxID=121088 RepID=A0A8S1IKB1_9CHLO|nr:unnamed protein product [Ostreobium quekettii]
MQSCMTHLCPFACSFEHFLIPLIPLYSNIKLYLCIHLYLKSMCWSSLLSHSASSGDSGSPALEAFAPSNSISAGRPALDIAVGITSFGGSVSCPDNMLPSVFTRLSSYRQWIDGVIQGSSSAVAESDSISPPPSEPPTPSSPPSTAEVPSAASFAAEPDSIPPLRFEPPTASSPPSTAEVPFALTPVPAQSSAAPPSPQPNPQNILWETARDGDEEMAKMALEAGADAEFEYSLFGNSSEVVATPLYVASRNGHVNVVKVLLAAKANPDHGTNKRSTPLMAAAEHGHFLVVQALIKAGADPKKKRANGDTALHFAAAQLGNSSERIVDALLDAGAVLDARGGDGQTPLMWAAYFGNLGMVEQLIKEGADSSIKDDHGATALESVCGCQFFEGSTGDIACPKGGCDLPSTAEEIRSLLS